jgi:hypothetical protein
MKRENLEISSNGNNRFLPPHPHELEISLFGPGYGESILIHLGQGDWVIVDSCIDSKTKSPTSISYLDNLGLNPADTVKQVIATHWHDDHVRGLSRVFENCKDASFVCSNALRSDEFLTVVRGIDSIATMGSSGLDEFNGILQILKNRKITKNSGFKAPIFALSDRCIWQGRMQINGEEINSRITALSPSDLATIYSHLSIAQLIPEFETTIKRIPSPSSNDFSVVLLVEIGDYIILLGSDLEETGEEETGWSHVLLSNAVSNKKAILYKVAHHGSANSDSPDIWDKLLEDNPIATLSPFNKGNVLLPKDEDKIRICSRSDYTFITRIPSRPKSRKRENVVDKQIKETVKSLFEVNSSPGHVRFRKRLESGEEDLPWNIELFEGAVHLNEQMT